jgi:hypothetical protein
MFCALHHYSEFHGFRSILLFLVDFAHFEAGIIFEAAVAVVKIGSSLESNYHMQYSLPKSVKHTVVRFSLTFYIRLHLQIT